MRPRLLSFRTIWISGLPYFQYFGSLCDKNLWEEMPYLSDAGDIRNLNALVVLEDSLLLVGEIELQVFGVVGRDCVVEPELHFQGEHVMLLKSRDLLIEILRSGELRLLWLQNRLLGGFQVVSIGTSASFSSLFSSLTSRYLSALSFCSGACTSFTGGVYTFFVIAFIKTFVI